MRPARQFVGAFEAESDRLARWARILVTQPGFNGWERKFFDSIISQANRRHFWLTRRQAVIAERIVRTIAKMISAAWCGWRGADARSDLPGTLDEAFA